jgi:hypothetical protein
MAQEFDYSLDFKRIDFRKHPELYIIGRGEQGVLSVEPYKSEILPHWRFRNVEVAQESAETIYQMFLDYKKDDDFVGMDMARKFLQMGYTRARRYANHASGRKYDSESGEELPRENNEEKAAAAKVFYGFYLKAREDKEYQEMKKKSTKKPAGKKKKTKKKNSRSGKNGLYANIRKAQKRAAAGGKPTRKKGDPGAPTEKDFEQAAKTAKS